MLVNPKVYRYKIGTTAQLQCLVYNDDTNDSTLIKNRTIKVSIIKNSTGQFLNFTTGSWGNGGDANYEKIMNQQNGIYLLSFNPAQYGETTDETYIVLYVDNADTGEPTWGGADYEILIYTSQPFIPPSPSIIGQSIVYGWCLDSYGQPLINARIDALIDKENIFHAQTAIAIERKTHYTYTDNNGYWELELIPNDLIIPHETKYIIRVNQLKTYEIRVPSSPGVSNFSDLIL